MPRGQHVALVQRNSDVNLAIENIARWHIEAIRRRKNGIITKVKHVQFGWITPQTYYQLQKIHDAVPIIVTVIEGGYRLKAAVWSYSIEATVLGSGIQIPIGVVIVTVAIALYAIDSATGNNFAAALDLASLVLPFGEVWLLWHGGSMFFGALAGIGSQISGLTSPDNPINSPEGIQQFIGLLEGNPYVVFGTTYNVLKQLFGRVSLPPTV